MRRAKKIVADMGFNMPGRNIHGIGVDIENVSRFKKNLRNERLLKTIFTKRELDYCMKSVFPQSRLAARFAGKEATFKALSAMKIKVPFNAIEILTKPDGRPFVNIKIPRRLGIKCLISLSHSTSKAIAFSAVIKDEKR